MKYEEAIEKWGALKLKSSYPRLKIDRVSKVFVTMNFEEGFNCCGGMDPDCYCSYAESPRATVEISGNVLSRGKELVLSHIIDFDDFDFATVIRELCEVGNGSIATE